MEKIQKRLLMIILTVFFTMTILGAAAATDESNNCGDRITKNVTNCNGTIDDINGGDIVKYNITVKRQQGQDEYYQVNDTLPAGLTFINATTYGTATSRGTYNNNTGMWTGIRLDHSYEYATLIIYAQVTDCGLTINNTARIYSREHNYGSWDYVGRASSSFYVPAAEVVMTKTGNGPLNVGETGTFTITITNNGPDDAQNVVVTDDAPSGFTDWNIPAGTTYDGHTWNIGTLAAGATKILTISGTITNEMADSTICNTATETQDTCNPCPVAPQTAEIKVNPMANVTITKVGNGPLNVGQTGIFTITLHNNGPNTAHNVVVTDVIPAGFTAGTPSKGTVVDGVWTVGDLADGEEATLTINGLITQAMAGTNITNCVTETQCEFTQESQEACATIYVKKCNLYVNVTPINVSTTIGGTTTLTYKLGNNGPDSADNVVMQFVIPDGLEFVSANVDVGSYTYDAATRTLTWNLGNVPVGDPYLWLSVRVLRAGSFVINSDITSGTCTGQPVVVSAVTFQAAGGEPEPVNAASKTIGMQNTGAPIGILILAVLAVLGGLIVPRMKK